MTLTLTPSPRPSSPALPAFLEPTIDRYYTDRIEKGFNGRHLFIGAEPRSGDLLLKTNDYLALSDHPEVTEAHIDALRTHGNGLMMSAVFLNGANPQRDFEIAMAKHLRAEATVVSQSGYIANVGLIQAIASPDTPVYVDMLAHASLWHGILAAGSKPLAFRHNDLDHLHRQLMTHGPGIVIIDSVYSTNGSIAPITETVELAERFGCAIIVDESHSLGTHGPAGAGLVVALGLEERVHFRTASLAKAFCGRGGIVACSRRVSEFLTYSSLPNIFSSAVLPHEFAALQKTLEIVGREEWRRHRLHKHAAWLRERLDDLGYDLGGSASQIISLESGTEERTFLLRDALETRGIFGAPFCAPATPKSRACIRLSLHCDLTQADLEYIVAACKEIREEIGMWEWASTKRKLRRRSAKVMHEAA